MMERWTNERGFPFSFNFESRDVEKKGGSEGRGLALISWQNGKYKSDRNTRELLENKIVLWSFLTFYFYKKSLN